MFGSAADAAEADTPFIQYVGDGPPPAQVRTIFIDFFVISDL